MSAYLRYLCRGMGRALVTLVAMVLYVLWRGDATADMVPIFLGLALLVCSFVGITRLPVRAHAFELGFPLSARALVWSRVAVYTGFGWACIWLPALVLLSVHPGSAVVHALRLTPLVPATVSLLYALPPYHSRAARPWKFGLAYCACIVAIPVAIVWEPAWLALIAVTAVCAGTLWTRLPSSLAYRPTERRKRRLRLSRVYGPWWFAFRHGVLRLPVPFMVVGCAVFIWVPAGWIFGAIFGVWMVGAYVVSVRERLRMLRPLPVAPQRLCPFVIVPPLLILVAAYLVVVHLPSDHPAEVDGIGYRGVLGTAKEHWRLGRGADPVARAPWGEECPLPHVRVLGTRYYVFDPFATGVDSSPRFVRHQLDRALREVYGIEVDTAPLFRPRLVASCFEEARASWPRPMGSGRAPAACLLIVAFWYLVLRPLFPRLGVLRRSWLYGAVGWAWVLFAVAWWLDVLPLLEILARRSFFELASVLPGLFGWAVAAAAIVGGYGALARRFAVADDAYGPFGHVIRSSMRS